MTGFYIKCIAGLEWVNEQKKKDEQVALVEQIRPSAFCICRLGLDHGIRKRR